MASYPSGVITWANVTDAVDVISASHINNLYAEVIAMENALKTSGTPQFARMGLGKAANGIIILDITQTATSGGNSAINVLHTGNGSSGTIYGYLAQVTGNSVGAAGIWAEATGVSTNNFGGRFVAQNATTNYAGYFTSSGGTTNWGVYVSAGKNFFAEYVGIGTGTPESLLHVNAGDGAIRVTDNQTNSTTKFGRLVTGHYTNSEEGLFIAGGTAVNGTNTVYIGGGSSIFNAASTTEFYNAANSTTVTGTKTMSIIYSTSQFVVSLDNSTLYLPYATPPDTTTNGRIYYDGTNFRITTGGAGQMVLTQSGNTTSTPQFGRMGLGVAADGTILFKIRGTSNPQARIEYDANNYVSIGASSSGNGFYTCKGGAYHNFGNNIISSETRTITGTVADGDSAQFRSTPVYTAATAQTVTRHNYFDLNNVSGVGVGPAAITDACVFRFDAAIGTHKAVGSGTTKTSPGTVTAWVKININGTLHYIPAYSSTTS